LVDASQRGQKKRVCWELKTQGDNPLDRIKLSAHELQADRNR